ncbi:acetyltransferase [Cryomorpha ignava]|uniref:Acetyltransferase n=1 Tax=Cryomorpha ignava TaxID=101383 RepID=A0A7K3WRR7_9FLAO|nr:acetyltransferase [Cryomorpha ignava]NEN23405.1 acetyltransferase [Cryomorpha ignava]
MSKKLILFGTGDIAQIAKDYFECDTEYKVVAFCLDKDFIQDETYEERPLVAFENIEEVYPPDAHDMFIALSYTEMNRLRQRKFDEALAKGYNLPSYISPKATYLSKYACGKNCFIFEDNTIQPYVKIGDNVTLWSGNHIGHHSEIYSHNFISSHVVISGHCEIGSYCFLGVNSTLAHNVKIAEGSLIGAGAIITKDTDLDGVYVAPRTIKLDKPSTAFKL